MKQKPGRELRQCDSEDIVEPEEEHAAIINRVDISHILAKEDLHVYIRRNLRPRFLYSASGFRIRSILDLFGFLLLDLV